MKLETFHPAIYVYVNVAVYRIFLVEIRNSDAKLLGNKLCIQMHRIGIDASTHSKKERYADVALT